jgi:hypothetical protein
MAEERTLGLARAKAVGEEESKEELQRRMSMARDSISHTVTEIKETVAHQVQAVRDTLDWREQFRKRPVAWSAGALGAGFVAGYSLAGVFKHKPDVAPSRFGYSNSSAHRLTASALTREAELEEPSLPADADKGPGLIEKFKESPAYDALSKEASSLGSKLVQELSTTAHLVVLPFLLTKLKEIVGINQIERANAVKQQSANRTGPGLPPRSESNLGH